MFLILGFSRSFVQKVCAENRRKNVITCNRIFDFSSEDSECKDEKIFLLCFDRESLTSKHNLASVSSTSNAVQRNKLIENSFVDKQIQSRDHESVIGIRVH